MRVLFLAPHPFFQHRGTPIAVKLLLEVLSQKGHRIQVITYHEGEDVGIPNVSIHRIPALPGIDNIRPGPSWKKIVCDAFMLLECVKVARRSRFDIIHAVEESVFMAMVIGALFRIPFVYDMDSSLVQQMVDKFSVLQPLSCVLRSFERVAVRRSLAVLAVCKSLEKLAREYDVGKLVRCVEDISLLGSGDQETGDVGDLDKTNSIVMYVGNLESYQGIDLLLESFSQASSRVPGIELVIVGGSIEDIARYKEKSRQLGVEHKTCFVGQKPISQLAFYLSQASVLVSPRLQGQNTPMKIYSYLDSGKPILATRLATHTQVLDDNVALLVPPEPCAMAEGLVTLLTDERMRDALSRRAKALVRNEFSLEAFQSKVLNFYQSLERKLAGIEDNGLCSGLNPADSKRVSMV